MLAKVKQSLLLVEARERVVIIVLTFSRALLGLLDIAGIFLIGILLAKGTNQLTGKGSTNKALDMISNIAGDLNLIQLASLALFLFLSKSLFASLLMKFMMDRFAKVETEIATKVYLNLIKSPISKVSKFSQSEIVYALTYSSGFAITQLFAVTVIIFSEFFLLIFVSIIFAFVNLTLTLYIVIYFIIIGILIYRTIGLRFQKAGATYASSSVLASTTVEDSLVAYREIYTLSMQGNFEDRFRVARAKLAKSTSSISYLSGLPRYIIESALMIGAVGLAGFTLSTGDPASAAGTLGIFLTGGLRIMASMLPLQNSLGTLKQLTSQADSFLKLSAEFPAPANHSRRGLIPKSFDNKLDPIEVELSQVIYIYEGSEVPAVDQVSLNISQGDTVAFIGSSGSGKSTLADLIVGLLSPTSGAVSVKNPDDRNIGYVPQTPGIISGTIAQNVTLDIDKRNIDQIRLENALKLSHLTELVNTLENGADTELGAQADGLSGGQLQRIGLARAIYSNPGLLVLDEATSALDAETEAAVSDSLRTLHGKCTIIVIAHRLSTIQNADKVFVFDKGKLVAFGKFSDLVETNEIVARFFQLSKLEITD